MQHLSDEAYKAIAPRFVEYQQPTLNDPFKKVHWAKLKGFVDSGFDIIQGDNCGLVVKKITKPRKVKDFAKDTVGETVVGDYEIAALYYDNLGDILKIIPSGNLWAFIDAENPKNIELVKALELINLSARIAGVGSDIYGIYYRGDASPSGATPLNRISLSRIVTADVAALREEILAGAKDIGFIVGDRGEDYGGAKKTWTRVFISPTDRKGLGITDESVRNHELFQRFPSLRALVEKVAPIERTDFIGLMQVAPDEGFVKRHTDIALDKQIGQGFKSNQVSRIHIPIVSNPQAYYHMWGVDGVRCTVVMKEGEVWYMDKRKPHAVENKGGNTRIHLLFDVYGSDDFSDAVLKGNPTA